jgi:hypothetical protein
LGNGLGRKNTKVPWVNHVHCHSGLMIKDGEKNFVKHLTNIPVLNDTFQNTRTSVVLIL